MRRAPCPLAAALLLAAALAAPVARAHEGDSHGEAVPAASRPGSPQRLPDASVHLPKSAQRQLGLRTLPVQGAAWPLGKVLQGVVVADPNAGGPVQATQDGRLWAPPGGFPALGQRVRRGQLLAWLEPLGGSLERSAQRAQLAELQAQLGLNGQRLARLRQLSDTVPRRELEAAEAEQASLQARVAALGQGLDGREALRAPVDGVLASAQAQAGQLVEARERVFEVVDPRRLRIEALAYTPLQASEIGAAFLERAEGPAQPLRFLGAAGRLREQAQPLQFGGAQGLLLGEPVRVVVQSRQRVSGHAVPAEALLRNAANQAVVWVKRAPEHFVPRVVQVQALDGRQRLVTQGLGDGERVVVQGAAALNQVR